jgi:hypothetical protein
VFASRNTYSYIVEMTKMREILAYLMQEAGDDAYSLHDKCGVPQPTTQRFLSGKHGDPRSATVKKWAAAYGVTESQLRGDAPLEGIKADTSGKSESNRKTALTKEQIKAIALMQRMDKKTRLAMMTLFESLVPDRRKENLGHSPGRRLDDQNYEAGPDLSQTYDQPSESEQMKGRKTK